MTKPFPFLTNWQEWCTTFAAAVAATFTALKLIPKIARVLKIFYEGALFMVDIKDNMNAIERRIIDRLSRLDDGQLNIIEGRRQMLNNDVHRVWFITDGKGKTEWVNDTWRKWTGIDPDDARGSGWENGIAPEDLHRVIQGWQMAIDHQRGYADAFSYIDREGRRTRVEVQASPIRRSDGTILNYFGNARLPGSPSSVPGHPSL
ncbi:MAG: PAS domain-containing protein [Chthoniobacter sp.]|uniref:PAS domain-containing protein n=1 Tax=Chthoniobacter sp. TaxID=2510640 RepID=UPI0032A91D47